MTNLEEGRAALRYIIESMSTMFQVKKGLPMGVGPEREYICVQVGKNWYPVALLIDAAETTGHGSVRIIDE